MQDVSSFLAPNRCSAQQTSTPVKVVCVAPGARRVYLAGDFNAWDPSSLPMSRQPNGAWMLQLSLRHGHHRYQFLVDGTPTLDPRAHGTTRDSEGAKASLLAVS